MTNESRIQSEIQLAMSEAGYLVWRQQVGKFRAMHSNHVVKIGINGMSDLGCIVPVVVTPEMVGKTIGVAAQIECKRPGGRESMEQATWGQAVRYRGGIYVLADSVDICRQKLQVAIEDIKK